jgi:hypothetical protein
LIFSDEFTGSDRKWRREAPESAGRPKKLFWGPKKVSMRSLFNQVGEGSSVPKPYSPPPHPLLRHEKPSHSGEEFRPLRRALRSAATSPPFPMAPTRRCGRGGGRISGGGSSPRPPVLRSEAERAKWMRSEGARRWSRNGAHDGDDEVPSGGSCSLPLPSRPHSSDDDTSALPITSGNCAEANVIELTALVVA